ncbi:pyridoxal-phosphate dependent enzyme [Thalassobellus sediminis]|uniref:pyridoxal-phosphate dependent enzyme n=1 Tax=Thalassobellus sediminis TaxID=3367753 RepID=UPI0037AC0CAE
MKDATLIGGYDTKGYGVVAQNEIKAIKELAQNEGIILDPVYSGRAFYGMLDYIIKSKIEKGSNVLFWHTGGLPANFYYSNELIQ